MPRRRAFLLILFSTALNAAGFLFNLFEPVPLYDEIAHLVTPYTLVAITSEIIYRSGGDDVFFSSSRRSLLSGAAIGLVGAVGWELVEVAIPILWPDFEIYNPLPDSTLDVLLGVCGGALGAWRADRYLDRLLSQRNR